MRLPHLLVTAICLSLVTVSPARADADASIRDLAKRAAMGQTDARFELGRRFKRGINVPVDPHAAVEHFCTAARNGHADAAYTLGRMYLTGGLALPSDAGQAAAWFKLAADAGHPSARAELGKLPRGRAAKPACSGRELVESEHRAPRNLVNMIRRMAPGFGLDPDFVLAVVAVESAFRIDAISPMQARGLMQLTDATSEWLGVRDPMDAEQNLRGGMKFLADLINRYEGDLRLVLAAYNAGPGAVQKYDGVPPFAETKAYIKKVRRYFPRDRHPVQSGPLGIGRLPGTLVAALPDDATADSDAEAADGVTAVGAELAPETATVGISPGSRQTARPAD